MQATCPKCGSVNSDDWPIEVDGNYVDGGCWEDECDRKHYDAMLIAAVRHPEGSGREPSSID